MGAHKRNSTTRKSTRTSARMAKKKRTDGMSVKVLQAPEMPLFDSMRITPNSAMEWAKCDLERSPRVQSPVELCSDEAGILPPSLGIAAPSDSVIGVLPLSDKYMHDIGPGIETAQSNEQIGDARSLKEIGFFRSIHMGSALMAEPSPEQGGFSSTLTGGMRLMDENDAAKAVGEISNSEAMSNSA